MAQSEKYKIKQFERTTVNDNDKIYSVIMSKIRFRICIYICCFCVEADGYGKVYK